MEANIKPVPVNNSKDSKTLKPLNFLKAEGVILVIAIIIILIMLKLLNIFPFPSKEKSNNIDTKTTDQKVVPTNKISPTPVFVNFICPLPEKECTQLVPSMNDKNKFIGVSGRALADKSSVIAIFDGSYTVLTQAGRPVILTLKSTDGIYKAVYQFSGTSINKSGDVSKGSVIGTTGSKTDFFFQIIPLKENSPLPIRSNGKEIQMIVSN